MMAESKPAKPAKLVFRQYRDDDNDACELLEERANQFRKEKYQKLPVVGCIVKKFQDNLIQVYLRHPQGFDARAKTAEDYDIIVCEDETHSMIIAVVVVNIRTVLWSGTPIKVGWLYGLRVDQTFQRMGIGRTISKILEERCMEKGVSLLYFTVNDENEKAKSFYRALGYKPASQRAQSAKFLTAEEDSPDDIVVIRLSPRMAASLTYKYYVGKDLSLPTEEAYMDLFTADDYECTLLAIHKSDFPSNCTPYLQKRHSRYFSSIIEDALCNEVIESYAGVSLWNNSAMKTLEVKRLGFSKEMWLSPSFQVTLLATIVTPLAVWGASVVGRIMSSFRSYGLLGGDRTETSNDGYWRIGFLVGETMLMLFTSCLSWKTASFFRFVVTRDSHRLTVKAFATFRHGTKGTECLNCALVASRNEARTKGYGAWILNVSDKHPDKECFPKSGFYTQWMLKWLRFNDWTEFAPDVFCDPRNM